MNEIDISKAIAVIKDLNYRLAKDGITRQANNMAIRALEEKQRREQGCEYCREYKDATETPLIIEEESGRGVYLFKGNLCCNSGEFCEVKISFCPMCGRGLDYD